MGANCSVFLKDSNLPQRVAVAVSTPLLLALRLLDGMAWLLFECLIMYSATTLNVTGTANTMNRHEWRGVVVESAKRSPMP